MTTSQGILARTPHYSSLQGNEQFLNFHNQYIKLFNYFWKFFHHNLRTRLMVNSQKNRFQSLPITKGGICIPLPYHMMEVEQVELFRHGSKNLLKPTCPNKCLLCHLCVFCPLQLWIHLFYPVKIEGCFLNSFFQIWFLRWRPSMILLPLSHMVL